MLLLDVNLFHELLMCCILISLVLSVKQGELMINYHNLNTRFSLVIAIHFYPRKLFLNRLCHIFKSWWYRTKEWLCMYRQKTIEISAYHSPLLNVKEKALIITTDQLFDSLGLCALIEYIRNQGKNISSTLQCNIYKHISENRFHEESKDCSGKNIFTRQIVCVYTCTNIPASSSYIVVCSNKM